jgi:hypothetical protein
MTTINSKERRNMLFNKPLAEIDENDLQALVDNHVREGREIEYKEALTIYTEEQKQEFLNDISSFANMMGGYLIYGVKENKEDAGIPIKVCGIKGDNPGKLIGSMRNIIETGLDPRLYGISISPITLPSHEGRIAILLHIPRSYASPHMVKSSGRFYSRDSVGKCQLDVTQLRTAFGLSGIIAERIRSFRAERLSRISVGEETPVFLDEQAPKLVLHMIPFNAFSNPIPLDLKSLNDGLRGQMLKPLIVWDLEPNVTMRFNMDGIARCNRPMNSSSLVAYTQVFRNGIIETVDTSILGVYTERPSRNGSNLDSMLLHGERYERRILETTKRYIGLQKFLGINPPIFIMVSFLSVKGYRITHPMFEHRFEQYSDEIDRTNLIIAEISTDNLDVDLAEAMRPIFDTVWNAAGYISSPNYDDSGKFKFGY